MTADNARFDLLVKQRDASIRRLNATVSHPHGTKYDAPGTVRERPEPDDHLRNPFQADRERIVLCKAFRRLKHKTQVFWAPRTDRFRTRITHTIEVAQTARVLGALLGLNTDLIEAIAYGHDVGHPPFGHAGERALQLWIQEYLDIQATKDSADRDADYGRLGGLFLFDHHEWALKLLQHQEEHHSGDESEAKGLNLTELVRAGIRNPSLTNTSSLEAQVVGVADDLTWINHDYDDFQAARVHLPPEVFDTVRHFGATRTERTIRAVADIVRESLRDGSTVQVSAELREVVESVRGAHHDLYDKTALWQRHEQGARMLITQLMSFLMTATPDEIDKGFRGLVGRGWVGSDNTEEISFLTRWITHGIPRLEASVDLVAKMTDTFALDLYRYLYSPETLDYYF